MEPERAEHRNRRRLVGDDFDDDLPIASLERLEHGVARQVAAYTASAMLRCDDHAQFRDVARPGRQRHQRGRADDLAAVDRDRAAGVRVRPCGEHGRVGDVLLEERAVALRDASEETPHRLLVTGLERPDLHQRARGGSTASLCSASHAMSAGSVWLSARLPVANVTWPPPSRSSWRPAGFPMSRLAGADAVDATTLSFSANALRTLPSKPVKSTTRPPRRIFPVISTFLRTSSSTTCLAAAPGKGSCSRDHCAIAW